MYSYDRRAAAFQVKKLDPETVLEAVELEGGRTVGFKSPKSITYAVVDSSGRVVKTKGALGKDQFEIYPKKSVAEQVAKYLTEKR